MTRQSADAPSHSREARVGGALGRSSASPRSPCRPIPLCTECGTCGRQARVELEVLLSICAPQDLHLRCLTCGGPVRAWIPAETDEAGASAAPAADPAHTRRAAAASDAR
ncbi:hypothetical protein QNA08_18785 [Chelatococcus sp. SYSU_G07232]|uniref:Uncharacterized protein n=1 Tax=Chelatococcus albus TaxID=3047466 RepID=A0ABT7ALK4_9HYPH|nr:hypothetical protein [Chelatococcus sp. SYSU_G07232]MDJ1160263.1 hypothetical protein [Chelatococcus sp. SYSU_G07232]